MTAARIRSNSVNDLDHLKGFNAAIEDWHSRVVLLQVY